jgi:NADPH:quinone reductase-like Zn-dependent oxidoreductase
MKALLYTKYGPPDVLQIQEVEKPLPKANEVLVKVHASSVNALEWRRFTMPQVLARLMGGGLQEPKNKSIGGDLAGHVEAVGTAVTRFRPGDEVFGIARGAFAEYVCAVEEKLAPKPQNVSFEAAATVPIAALTALQALRDHGRIEAGQKVLIHGAGGGVGTFAVQIARAFGGEVTAVCGTHNLDMIRAIGASHVLDYTKEDFTRTGKLYDLVVGVNGNRSIFEYRRALKSKGIYVWVGGAFGPIIQALLLGPLLSRMGSKKCRGVLTRPNQADLLVLKELLETGKVVPVIDSCYPLVNVADAVRFLMHGHASGKVVITV